MFGWVRPRKVPPGRQTQAVRGGARGFDGERSRAKSRWMAAGKTKATASKERAPSANPATGGGAKAGENMLQPSTQHAGRCDGGGLPPGSWVAPSRVQMTLPKASSCDAFGAVPKANAPSVDWSSSRWAATSATRMLHRFSRLFKRSASSSNHRRDTYHGRGQVENRQFDAAATRHIRVSGAAGSPGSRSAMSGAPTSGACGRRRRPCRGRAI